MAFVVALLWTLSIFSNTGTHAAIIRSGKARVPSHDRFVKVSAEGDVPSFQEASTAEPCKHNSFVMAPSSAQWKGVQNDAQTCLDLCSSDGFGSFTYYEQTFSQAKKRSKCRCSGDDSPNYGSGSNVIAGPVDCSLTGGPPPAPVPTPETAPEPTLEPFPEPTPEPSSPEDGCTDTYSNVPCSLSATSSLCASQAWKAAGTCGCSCKAIRPHIVFFLIDDLGYADFGHTMPECDESGCPWPHLQTMIDDSVFVNSTYSESVCAPTRSSFMNGRWRHLMRDSSAGGYDWGSTSVRSERSIAQKVKEYDYKAYVVGKWHVGEKHYLFTPTGRGFHRYYGQWTNSDHFKHCHYKQNKGFDLHYQEQNWSVSMDPELPYHRYVTEGIGKYSTELYTEATYRFLKEHKQRYPGVPFFLHYALYALHTPMESAPEEGASIYGHNYYTMGGCTTAKYPNPKRRSLCAMNAAMDVALSNLTSLLKSDFSDDRYLVVVTGDNGGCVGCGSINTPLTGNKGQQYEGGIRNHAVVWGNDPALESLKGTHYRGGFMHLVDWHATFVELASLGMSPAPSHNPTYMSGTSVWTSIVNPGTPSPTTTLVSASEGSEKKRNWYIRVGDWKLMINAHLYSASRSVNSAMELYHIGQDIEECPEDSADGNGIRQCSKNQLSLNSNKVNELFAEFVKLKENQRVTNGNEDVGACPASLHCVNDEAAALQAEFTSQGIVPCDTCTLTHTDACHRTTNTIAYPENSGWPRNTGFPEFWAGQ